MDLIKPLLHRVVQSIPIHYFMERKEPLRFTIPMSHGVTKPEKILFDEPITPVRLVHDSDYTASASGISLTIGLARKNCISSGDDRSI